MTLARTLPAELAPRFAAARRTLARSETASFEVIIAERFVLRLQGLAGLDEADVVPLLFQRCRSLHTFGMRTAIDLVWLDLDPHGEGVVLAVDPALPPRRTARAPAAPDRRRVAALELVAGDSQKLGLTPGARTLISRLG